MAGSTALGTPHNWDVQVGKSRSADGVWVWEFADVCA